MHRRMKKTILAGLLALAIAPGLAGCGKDGPTGAPLSASDGVELVRRGPGGTTRFMAKNVLYRLDANVSMFLTDMNADVMLKDPTLPFVPANKTDYSIQVHHAVVDKGASDLEALMNTYVFSDRDSPIRNVKMSFKGDRLLMSGEMKKVVWAPFSMEGTLSPTPDGKILMTPQVVKAGPLRVDGLMNLIGLEMAKLLKMKEEKGLIMQGNTIIMDPSKLYPPPALIGHVTEVAVRNNMLHIVMDDGKARPWPEVPVQNTKSMLLMWGGDVLINSVLNLNAKMQVLDASPATPQVFALDRYREQLEAGFVVPTRQGHLIAYVPDVLDYDGDMGRWSPPSWPVPGVKEGPSDLQPGSGGVRGPEMGGQSIRTVRY